MPNNSTYNSSNNIADIFQKLFELANSDISEEDIFRLVTSGEIYSMLGTTNATFTSKKEVPFLIEKKDTKPINIAQLVSKSRSGVKTVEPDELFRNSKSNAPNRETSFHTTKSLFPTFSRFANHAPSRYFHSNLSTRQNTSTTA